MIMYSLKEIEEMSPDKFRGKEIGIEWSHGRRVVMKLSEEASTRIVNNLKSIARVLKEDGYEW